MTLLTQETDASTDWAGEPRREGRFDALFPEAEHRQRFRRARLALGLVVLLGAGATIGAIEAGGGGGSATFGLTSSAFNASVAYATAGAGSARMSIAEDRSATDQCVERSQPAGIGEVSFGQQDLFFDWPTTACGASSGGLTRSELVGGKEYLDVASRTAQHAVAGSVWRELLPAADQPATEGLLEFFQPVARTVSPAPWLVLGAVRGSLRVVGHSSIRGTMTTEFRGNASLASLIATFPSLRHNMNGVNPRTPLSKLMVPASKIDIPVLVWLDAQHRIRRLELSEPMFEANIPHTRDGIIPGFDLSPTMTVAKDPNQLGPDGPSQQETVRLTHLRVTATFRLAIDLYDFGLPFHLSAPRDYYFGGTWISSQP